MTASRAKTKAQPLLDKGAQWADSPRAAAKTTGIDVIDAPVSGGDVGKIAMK